MDDIIRRARKNLADSGANRLDPDVGNKMTLDGAKIALMEGSKKPLS